MDIVHLLTEVDELYNIFDIKQVIILSRICKQINVLMKNKSIKYQIILKDEKLLVRLIKLCNMQYIFSPKEFELCLQCFIKPNKIHDSKCIMIEDLTEIMSSHGITVTCSCKEINSYNFKNISDFFEYLINYDRRYLLDYFDIFYTVLYELKEDYNISINIYFSFIVIESIKYLYPDVGKLIKFMSKFNISIRHRFFHRSQDQKLIIWVNQISSEDKYKLFHHTSCTDLLIYENIDEIISDNLIIESEQMLFNYILYLAVNDCGHTVLIGDIIPILDIMSIRDQLYFNYMKRLNGEMSKEEYQNYISETIYRDGQ